MKSIIGMTVVGLLVMSGSAFAYECKSETIGATTKSEFFIVDGGTVTDLRFGLMWDMCSYGQQFNVTTGSCEGEPTVLDTWTEALNSQNNINSSNLYGYNDWRLPNIKELASIVERQCRQPAINLEVFKGTVNGVYWTNSPDGLVNPGHHGRLIDFSDSVEFYRATGPKKFARHVRTVK